MRGIDYAFFPHPSIGSIHSAGMGWVGRYVSPIAANDSNGKNILKAEAAALLSAGVEIVLFAESTAGRILAGHAAGVADAQHFDSVVKAVGMPGAVMFCAADFDATPGNQTAIDAYLDGAAFVIGHGRIGLYGGYFPVMRALDHGKAAFACQTLAWSGPPKRTDPHTFFDGQTNWDKRALIRQHLSIRVGGVSVDLDESFGTDFGQYPRPVKNGPAPDKPEKLSANGLLSLRRAVNAHGTTLVRSLELTLANQSGKFTPQQATYIRTSSSFPDGNMPRGMPYWVGK